MIPAKFKVYVPVIGAVGLAVFQASTGDYQQAITTVLAAFGGLGVFHGVVHAVSNR